MHIHHAYTGTILTIAGISVLVNPQIFVETLKVNIVWIINSAWATILFGIPIAIHDVQIHIRKWRRSVHEKMAKTPNKNADVQAENT